MDQDSDILPDDATKRIIPCLTKEKWVIVSVAENPEENMNNLSNSYF